MTDHDLVLRYAAPAGHWCESLPLGNGRLGAMVMGRPYDERIALNEDSLWAGGPRERTNPAALAALPRVRELLFAGKHGETTRLAGETMLGVPQRIDSYEPLCDLLLSPNFHGDALDYARDLDLDNAITTTRWRAGDATYTRTQFVSAVDGALIIRLSADRRGAHLVRVRLTRETGATSSASASASVVGKNDGGGILLRGATAAGLAFAASLRMSLTGGEVVIDGDSLRIGWADEVLIVLCAATGARAADPAAVAEAASAAALARGYTALETAHRHDHQALFRRFTFRLAAQDRSHVPLPERLRALRDGALDTGLHPLAVQYRRYIQIASSRPGSLPSNLQGIWNQDLHAAWNSDFHPNINLQMNYWPAEAANLPETVLPLIDWLESIVPSGERTARVHYGCRGWVLHHVSDPWGTTTPCDGIWGIWPVGAAWMVQHAWWHWQYSRDRDFLARRAWPLIRGATRFILDFLVEAPAGSPVAGMLVTNPSHSPENAFRTADGGESHFTYAATMDLGIIRELFSECLACCTILGTDTDLAAEVSAARDRLPPYRISPRTGTLQEWVEDYEETDPGHRHLSHLFALFPGDSIDRRTTPELAAAAHASLVRRLAHHHGIHSDTGWAPGWLSCLWARLGEGDRALAAMTRCLAHRSMPNLMSDAHGHAQVGDMHGYAAGALEMLLQDHDGVLDLLPALPSTWADGAVGGLRARGGYTVGMVWSAGRVVAATISASHAGELRLRVAGDLDWDRPLRREGDQWVVTLAAGEAISGERAQ